MLSDQDDIWVDYKVKVTIDFLQQYDFVVSDATVVNEQLQVLYPSHFSMHGVKKGFIKNFINTRYIGACMSFKAEILKKALPFPRNQKYCAHDYWLTLIAERFYNTGLIYEPLVLYRRHSNNVLTGGIISTNSLFKKIYTRAYCLINLVFRYGK
jgi:hypothetical protein